MAKKKLTQSNAKVKLLIDEIKKMTEGLSILNKEIIEKLKGKPKGLSTKELLKWMKENKLTLLQNNVKKRSKEINEKNAELEKLLNEGKSAKVRQLEGLKEGVEVHGAGALILDEGLLNELNKVLKEEAEARKAVTEHNKKMIAALRDEFKKEPVNKDNILRIINEVDPPAGSPKRPVYDEVLGKLKELFPGTFDGISVDLSSKKGMIKIKEIGEKLREPQVIKDPSGMQVNIVDFLDARMELLQKSPSKVSPQERVALVEIMTGVDLRKMQKPEKGIFEKIQAFIIGDQYNYCGSKTDILGNLEEGKDPINDVDGICMAHDLDYLEIGTIENENERIFKVRNADNRLENAARNIIKDINKKPVKNDLDKERLRAADIVVKAMQTKTAFTDPLTFISDVPKLTDNDKIGIVLKIHQDLHLKQISEKQREGVEDYKEASEEVFPIDMAELDRQFLQETGVSNNDDEGLDVGEEQDLEEGIGEVRFEGEGDQLQQLQRASQREEVRENQAAEHVSREDNIEIGEIVNRMRRQERRNEERQEVNEGIVQGQLDEHGEAAKMKPVPTGAIVGERSMRPLLFREEGDVLEKTDEQIRQNKLWLDNFNWIDDGKGNGNQQRLPWRFSGKSENTLWDAQLKNEDLRFSGPLFTGGQQIKRVKTVSGRTRQIFRTPMIPGNQNNQMFRRNGPLLAGLGRPLMMANDNDLTPMSRRNSNSSRLFYPDVVDNKRL